MVFQNPENQIVGTVVEEDTAFGPENQGIPPKEIEARVETALRVTGLIEKRKKPTYTLREEKTAPRRGRGPRHGYPVPRPRRTHGHARPRRPGGTPPGTPNLHASGKTIVSITHRLEEILSCDRAIILHRGEIAWEGTVSALFLSDLPFKEWGLDIPPLVSFWRDLRAEGRSVPPCDGGGHGRRSMSIIVSGLGHTYHPGTPLKPTLSETSPPSFPQAHGSPWWAIREAASRPSPSTSTEFSFPWEGRFSSTAWK